MYANAMDATAARGEKIFAREGCANCRYSMYDRGAGYT
jgi:hypothetical protein